MNECIAKDNADSLLIYRKLCQTFERCEKHAAPYLNLVALFFHDIMCILTGLALCRNELEGPFSPPKETLPPRLESFPYIGYRDVWDGINVDSKHYKRWASRSRVRRSLSRLKWDIISRVSPLTTSLRANRRLWATVGSARHNLLMQSGFRVDFRVPRSISIPGRFQQLQELRATVSDICQCLDLSRYDSAVTEVLERHILARSREVDLPKTFRYDLVLTGTLLALEYRFMAAMGRHYGVPVVSLCHGEADGIYNEPWIGYGERTFPNFYIGYGEAGNVVPENEHYRKGLYEQPTYVSADSDFVRREFRTQTVESLKSLVGKRLMYVPSQFYGQRRYGPFHFPRGQLYLTWQEALFKEFPGLIWKRHPKEFDEYKVSPRGATHVVDGRLEDCLDESDVFVFDVLSGAAWSAAATSKVIIYFNIGLRNLTTICAEAVRQRCIWIDIDPAQPTALRERVETQLSEPKINNIATTFCLRQNGNAMTREQSVVEQLRLVVK